ncbi:Phosphatidylinositol-3-phosphatase myotubularin-1 [Linum perenne]
MAASRTRRSASYRGEASSDSEKMESSAGWDDALDWLKLDESSHPPVVSRSISFSHHHANYKCLLERERVLAEGHGVVLVNTDEAGTLVVTNFRLMFLSEGTQNIVALGTIPLATIEKLNKLGAKNQSAPRQSEKSASRRLLQVIGKDMRIIVFGFRPRTKQRRAIYLALQRSSKPLRIWDLFAFSCGTSKFGNTNPKVRLLNEYFRLLGKGSYGASMNMIEKESYMVSNALWRISNVNSSYSMCQTYPFALVLPNSVSDEEVIQASTFRARGRLPVISWCHPVTGAVLARSSQPLVGLMMNLRSNADEKLVAALCNHSGGARHISRKLYIADARPRKNALANGAMGGGSESSSNYFQSEVVFLGIDNIHAMRESLSRLRDYLDTHGTTSSDGMSSFLRHGGWTWGGGNLSSMSASVSAFGDSGWLTHVQSVLTGAAWIAGHVALESASVLVHCSDGWDRTTQLVALANLLLDPYYRSFSGFQALIEKDWLAFGHPFADRNGIPTVSGSSKMPFELTRQASVGSFPPSHGHQSVGSTPAPSASHAQNNCSPIFSQWVDCVSQLLRIYPFAFEFSSAFLVDLLDCMMSCRFGNFFCNSERERQQIGVAEACGCMWAYLADVRSSQGRSHGHFNLFYDPLKHDGPLLPPAAALAPTLWPQFHLRWACPSEAQAGELEDQCREMSLRFNDLQKAKDVAEKKAAEMTSAFESLSVELRHEKQLSSSAMALAKRASKESAAIKRAIQSLGCNVHFASGSDIETSPLDNAHRLKSSHTQRESDRTAHQNDPSDVSVSISVVADENISASNPITRMCESVCPLRTREGGCKWPDAGCAQLGSQFLGLKANYDAFDRLSIYDSYFQTD